MFLASNDELRRSLFDGENFSLNQIELPAFMPWFMCEVPQFEEDSDEAVCTSTYLIGDVNKLSEFAGINKIDKTFIISPGYVAKTENWCLLRLISIAQASYKIDDSESRIYRFEIDDGTFIEQDVSGMSTSSDGLKFETILHFN